MHSAHSARLAMLRVMLRIFALFLALQLVGCASKPASSVDPGPPILSSDSMELLPAGSASAVKGDELVSQALAEQLRQQLLEPTNAELSAPNYLITSYLGRVCTATERNRLR